MLRERDQPRKRRRVPYPVALLLLPVFRYSWTRNAYVLRLVGNRFGPVLAAPPPPVIRRERKPPD